MGKDKECVRTTCFRFNMDNPDHAKAWDYLHNYDKDKIKSTNVAAIIAVNDYFDRMGRLADDPYFETRQREERFVEQIVSEVGKAFIAEMPKFLASLMLSLNRGYPIHAAPMQAVSAEAENSGTYAESEKSADDDDYSAIDFDFIGG